MKIAITLLTCGRVDYTRRTLATLCLHNPGLRDEFVLLHGDDRASLADAEANTAAARAAGFETVLAPSLRYGVARMTELLFLEAQRRGADAVLNLQNDWESRRPLPRAEIEQLLAGDAYAVRLYGAMKGPGSPSGIHHGGRTPRQVAEWTPHATLPGVELADIHWGHPPAVTRIEQAIALTRAAPSEAASRRRSGEITQLTARFTDNVMSHIGEHRTTGFRA